MLKVENLGVSFASAAGQVQVTQGIDASDVHIGPSDHVPWLDDRKWAYVRLEGRAFGDAPLNLEYKLEVWDSPNSAGVIIDAVRAAKIAKDHGQRLAAEGEICWAGMHSWKDMLNLLEEVDMPQTLGFQAETSILLLFGLFFRVSISSVIWSISSLFQLRHWWP